MSQINPVYVKITAEHDIDGTIKPTILHWADGRMFEVDKVLDVRAAGTIGGGIGKRYRCKICNKKIDLFCDNEDNKWYIKF